MPRTRRLRASVTACISGSLLLVTAACTSDSATPDTAPTTPSSVVPTEAQPPTTEAPKAQPPALPAEAQEDTVAGASAFARHYWAMANYASTTGDLSALSSLSTDECNACRDLESSIASLTADGLRIDGGEAVVGEVSTTPGDPQGGLSTKLLFSQKPGVVRAQDGTTVSTISTVAPLVLGMVVIWGDGSWKVAEWGADEDG